MSPNQHHDQIRDQYSSNRGRHFYQTVMGDGGFDIHYGIYRDANTTMQQATLASTQRLLELIHESSPDLKLDAIVDLGSGRGGSAHFLAKHLSAAVTCADLSESHHAENFRRAVKVGLEDKISFWTGSFESLPADWTERFDLAWAQETFCHSHDLKTVVENAYRVTRSGGAIAISDIMLSDDASQSDAESFSSVNAITRLSSPAETTQALSSAGYFGVQFEDWSEYLAENFRRMLHQIQTNRSQLITLGVPDDYLAKFSESLNHRLTHSGKTLRWGAFIGRK